MNVIAAKNRIDWLGPSRLPISLVLATRNRADRLESCLRAIAAIDFDPRSWELIVADNGSTDATAEVVRAAQEYMPTTIKYVFEPARGASAARNAGTFVSVGSIIAYTDDDCYVAPDFLGRIMEAFEADQQLGWVTGRVELFDPADDPTTTNSSRVCRRFFPGRYVIDKDVIGANLAVRRSVMSEVGGYDEILGAGALLAAAEDLDVVSRISARGWAGAYNPDIVISHHHGRKSSHIASLNKGYSIGRGAYTIKYLYRGQIVPFLRGVASVRYRLGRFEAWRDRLSMVFWETYGGCAYTLLGAMKMLGQRPISVRRQASATHFVPASSKKSIAQDVVHGDGC